MFSKLATISWFLKHPQYRSHLPRVLARWRRTHLDDSREESTKWCRDVAVDQETVLEQLTGNRNLVLLADRFSGIMEKAYRARDACPYSMGGEGATSLLYALTQHRQEATRILETGVAYGWSSLAFLLAIHDREGATLVSNDMPYPKMGNDEYVGCVVPGELRNKWDLQRLPDIKGIPLAISKLSTLDIVHYDSDKSYLGRNWATPLIWDALAPGGLFISDDVNDNIAFKQFCEQKKLPPLVCPHENKYVGILSKPE